MSWTTPEDLKAQLRRLWDRGEVLAGLISGATLFPRRLVLKAPTSAELASKYAQAKQWVAQLAALPHLRVEYRDIHHRLLGSNRLPDAVYVDSLEDAVAVLQCAGEVSRFRRILAETRGRLPEALPWVQQYPLRALELADEWDQLLSIALWLKKHPRPGIYLRQIELPGVHTKFIEAHRGVLRQLLDLALPQTAIDATATGAGQFARRYGFLDKPMLIRFRLLDPALLLVPGLSAADITLDAASFYKLSLPIRRIFVVENEITFLAFPNFAYSLIVFGAGYGWEAFGATPWAQHCDVYYWGDLDTHGFAILDQLRAYLPHTISVLMDEATLREHQALWTQEPSPESRNLSRLRPEERVVYEGLREHRYGTRVRLEQERIGLSKLTAALSKLTEPTTRSANQPESGSVSCSSIR